MALPVRPRLAELLDRIGIYDALLRARPRLAGAWLTVVNYHRVQAPAAAAAFDEGVLDATPESLDRQLRVLRRYFTIIGLSDLLGYVKGGSLPPNPALITFDDGYRDGHDCALPVLLSHGVRAAFFIATDYVDRRRVFWWDQIGWLVKHARRARFGLEYPAPIEIDLCEGTAWAARVLQQIVKKHYALDLERFLRDLVAATDAPWDRAVEARFAEELIMTWDQVRALRQAGMDVGSHTRTHRVLQTLPLDSLEAELRGSRADLEREIGEPVVALAYPVGKPIAGIDEVRSAVEAAGYRLGLTYGTGIQRLGSFDPLDVSRLAVEAHFTDAQFRALLAIPSLVG